MTPVPDLTGADVGFGCIGHMPEYSAVPEEFQRGHNPFCHAAAVWFYSGIKAVDGGFDADGKVFKAKPGVDPMKALRAVGAILCSFEPKHEHKMAGTGFLLSEWFDAPSDPVQP